jgi:hypothetical protein
MTTRQSLDRVCRRATLISLVGGALLVLGGILMMFPIPMVSAACAIVGFLLFGAGYVSRSWGRCLSCGFELANRLVAKSIFRIDELAHFCPFCGKSLDENVESPLA